MNWIRSISIFGGAALALCFAPALAQVRTYDSHPLGAQFAVGKWQQIRLSIDPARQTGTLMLFSNRFVWDGFSPMPRLTPQTHAVRARLVSNPRLSPMMAQAGYSAKLYDLSLVGSRTSFPQLGLGARVRFVMSGTAFGASRLLLLNNRGEITRVVAMEPSNALRQPRTPDVFAYTTVYLPAKSMGNTRVVRLHGSFETGEAELVYDPNLALLDAFGNATASTRMAVDSKPVRLVERSSGRNPNVRVYDIEGAPMRLVVARNGQRLARLVMLDNRGRASGFQMLEIDYMPAAPLMGSVWRLERIVYNDDTTYRPEQGGAYRFQFSADGRLTGRLSANNLVANYIASGDRIRILTAATTLALGPPDNIETETLRALGQVDSFSAQSDELWLMLKYDSGTIVLKREKRRD